MEYPSSTYFSYTSSQPSYDHYEQPDPSSCPGSMFTGDICHSPVDSPSTAFRGSHEGMFDVDVKARRAFSFEELQSGAYFESLDESDFQFYRIYGQPVLIPSLEESDGSVVLHNQADVYPRADGPSCEPLLQNATRADNSRILISKSYTLANSLGEYAAQAPVRPYSISQPTSADSQGWQQTIKQESADPGVLGELVYPADYMAYPLRGRDGATITNIGATAEAVEQKPLLSMFDEEPPMDSLPYPPPAHSVSPPYFQPSTPPQDELALGSPSYIHNVPFEVGTSHDEWEDVTGQPPRLTVPSQSYVFSEVPSPTRTAFVQPHQHQHYPTSSHGHSHHHRSRSPSPRTHLRMSPIPHTKRSLDKKPALACLFCRGRKIACGPPLPGSKDKTCNQCARRHLKCEYPLESRRGMRKRRSLIPRASSSTPETSPGGPKVNVIKASRKRSVDKRSQ